MKMIVKVAAIVTLLGVCCALPVEEPKAYEDNPIDGLVPLEPKPGKVEDSPKPPPSDDSDLKTDANTWWHSWYHHEYPVYYFPTQNVPSVPVHYTYWKTY